jgi:hypothetical protein
MKYAFFAPRTRPPALRWWAALALGIWGLQPALAQRGQGYEITEDRIAVEQPSHWRNWTLPIHAVEVLPEGGIAPHLFRSYFNLLDDRDTFRRKLKAFKPAKGQHPTLNIDSTETLDIRGNLITKKEAGKEVPVYTYWVRMGISRAGSNPEEAAGILDGDPSTYWEPDPAAPLDDWWIEVDLGRVAVVDSVVVRFAGEELGDPFRQFRILVAPDQEPVLEEAGKVDFALVGRTTAPNREQREFSFALAQPRSSPEWQGRMVETIRLVVTDTKGGQGHLIDQAQWEALAPADRGQIVYFLKDEQGLEEPVAPEIYAGLSPERQGRRDYYRRERPRLADIEVWGHGDNISLGMVEGGGSLTLTGEGFSPGAAFDGDFSTEFLHVIREKTSLVDRGVLTIDMGATFWLDGVRTSSTLPRTYIDGYKMLGSDGTRDTNGQLKWIRLTPVERENNRTALFEHLFEPFASPPRLRFLEITILNPEVGRLCMSCAGPNIAEYQLFSHGYPAEVVFSSDLIALPPGRQLGRIYWEGDTPPGTQLEIRTRTGNLQRKVVRYFDKSGNEIPQKQWNNLLGSFKGPVDTAYVVGSDWSNWSRAYQQPGERVTSPPQSAFLQLQVKLSTEDPSRTASISRIQIELLEPVAERLVAELWPLAAQAPGKLDTFSLYVQPFFIERPAAVRSAGFDEVLLTLPGASDLELLELALGVDETGERASQVFRPGAGGAFFSEAGQQLAILQNRGDSIRVRLPDLMRSLPEGQGKRTYYRVTREAEQVPVDRKNELLTAVSYGQLAPEERGEQRYFRREVDEAGQVRLREVDAATYDTLGAEEREARYFRVLLDEGGQFPFDAAGEPLDGAEYGALSSSLQGRIVGQGSLMRLRFAAPVYVNGATVDLAVRNSAGGSLAPWQGVEAGDATGLVPGEDLSIQLPLEVDPLGDFAVLPGVFTPNGDGVNEVARIAFSVFKLGASRQAQVRIYQLDGRLVWEHRQPVRSGQTAVEWPGTDRRGQRVPPGIYLCQVELDVDNKNARATTRTRLVHVVY